MREVLQCWRRRPRKSTTLKANDSFFSMHCCPSAHKLHSWPLMMTDIAATSLSTNCLQPTSSTSATKDAARSNDRSLTSSVTLSLSPRSFAVLFRCSCRSRSQTCSSLCRRTESLWRDASPPWTNPAVVRVLGESERCSSPAAWGLGVNQAYFVCAFASQAEAGECQELARRVAFCTSIYALHSMKTDINTPVPYFVPHLALLGKSSEDTAARLVGLSSDHRDL